MYVCILEVHIYRWVGVNRPRYTVCMYVSITDIKVCVKLKISLSVNMSHNRMLSVQTV